MHQRPCVLHQLSMEEEERLIEHAKSLTAAVAAAHVDAEARNQEIYKQSGRFERDHLVRQCAFELASVAERAAAAGTVLHLSSSSVGSSSSFASYRARQRRSCWK